MDLVVENVDEYTQQSPVETKVEKIKFIDELDSRLDFAVSENDDNSTHATSSRRPQSTSASIKKFS